MPHWLLACFIFLALTLIAGLFCIKDIKNAIPFFNDSVRPTHADAVVLTALALRELPQGQSLQDPQDVRVTNEINSPDALVEWLKRVFPKTSFNSKAWQQAALAFVESRDARGHIREQVAEVLLLADYIKTMGRNKSELHAAYRRELQKTS